MTPEFGVRPVIPGVKAVTVKVTLLLATPFTVTMTGPVVALLGTGTAMLEVLQDVGVAAMPRACNRSAVSAAGRMRVHAAIASSSRS